MSPPPALTHISSSCLNPVLSHLLGMSRVPPCDVYCWHSPLLPAASALNRHLLLPQLSPVTTSRLVSYIRMPRTVTASTTSTAQALFLISTTQFLLNPCRCIVPQPGPVTTSYLTSSVSPVSHLAACNTVLTQMLATHHYRPGPAATSCLGPQPASPPGPVTTSCLVSSVCLVFHLVMLH
jgi:hypothetical protein